MRSSPAPRSEGRTLLPPLGWIGWSGWAPPPAGPRSQPFAGLFVGVTALCFAFNSFQFELPSMDAMGGVPDLVKQFTHYLYRHIRCVRACVRACVHCVRA